MERIEAEATIRAHYSEAAPTLIGGLVDLLGLIRRDFDGDLDRWLVFATVLLRTVSASGFRSISLDQYLGGQIPPSSSCATNARSIADALQIPRETVRRKVNELLMSGLIERSEHGLALTVASIQTLSPLRDETIRLAARYYRMVRRLKSSTGPRP